MRLLIFLLALIGASAATSVVAAEGQHEPFEDTLLPEALTHPDWFTLSSGDLRDDLKEAIKDGRKGIMLYFGQDRCAYCEQFIERSLGNPDIANYLKKNFIVIPIDIWGVQDIIDTDGKKYSERELSVRYKANFTPSVIFYNADGKPVFRLRGYYPPYQFRAALKYVTEGFYRKETFRDYIARAEPDMFFTNGDLIDRDFFADPPYDLSQKRDRILAVMFEQGNCHACELLHTGPLGKEETLKELGRMKVVQLDMWSDTEVVTPGGQKTSARQWAQDLELFYAPTILFFDESGKELMRVDSVVEFYRLWGVLDYMNARGYQKEPDYQLWRLQHRDISQ